MWIASPSSSFFDLPNLPRRGLLLDDLSSTIADWRILVATGRFCPLTEPAWFLMDGIKEKLDAIGSTNAKREMGRIIWQNFIDSNL
jgi:hypothetical protein